VRDLLVPDGLFITGDISFQSQKDFENNRRQFAHVWDDTEYYWTADLFIDRMTRDGFVVDYEQISVCGGIYVISNNSE
jgi:hypothetical protein